jgi:hypothetical protein
MKRPTIALLLSATLLATSSLAGNSDSSAIAFNCSLIATQRWHEKPIGVLLPMVAQLFIGKPYAAGTLDTSSVEECVFTSSGYDCVTLVESALALSRTAKLGECTYERFMRQLEFIRYRGGKRDGYVSRLHYTSDWIGDNQSKRVIENITARLGGRPMRKRIDFMSTHPTLYRQLRDSSALVPKIAAIERRLSSKPLVVVPLDRIAAALGSIQSGDIVAIATAKQGLDYAHLGIALRTQGKLGFIHASSKAGKVVFEPSLEEYVRTYPNAVGITVVRPLEPTSKQ